jgi:hypothetical protein
MSIRTLGCDDEVAMSRLSTELQRQGYSVEETGSDYILLSDGQSKIRLINDGEDPWKGLGYE